MQLDSLRIRRRWIAAGLVSGALAATAMTSCGGRTFLDDETASIPPVIDSGAPRDVSTADVLPDLNEEHPVTHPSGGLDPSFAQGGTTGRVFAPVETWGRQLYGEAFDVAKVPGSDDVVIVGFAAGDGSESNQVEIVLVKYLASGDLDPDFGEAGIVSTALQGFSPIPIVGHVVFQPDGRLVVLARVAPHDQPDLWSATAVLRYLPNGSLDPSFGTNGVVLIPTGFDCMPGAITVAGDGKILVGVRGTWPNLEAATVIRLLANGALDSTFGAQGIATGPAATVGGTDVFDLVEHSGTIAVAARLQNSKTLNVRELSILYFDAKGRLDPANPTRTTALSHTVTSGRILPGDAAYAVEVDNLSRILGTGLLDTGFGDRGTAAFSPDDLAPSAIAVQEDEKVVVGGNPPVERLWVARLLRNGELDPSFASAGIADLALEDGYSFRINAITVLSDGRIVVVGWRQKGNTGYDFFAARLFP